MDNIATSQLKVLRSSRSQPEATVFKLFEWTIQTIFFDYVI